MRNSPYFWNFFSFSHKFSLYCLSSLPFENETFFNLLRFWAKFAGATKYFGKDFSHENDVEVAQLLQKDREKHVLGFNHLVAESTTEENAEVLQEALFVLGKAVMESIVSSVAYFYEQGEVDSLFSSSNTMRVFEHLPALMGSKNMLTVLLEVMPHFHTMHEKYMEWMETAPSSPDFSITELQLACFLELLTLFARFEVSSREINEDKLGFNGFVELAACLLKTVASIHLRRKKQVDQTNVVYLEVAFLRLLEFFARQFFDSGSELNYYSNLFIDSNFYEALNQKSQSFFALILEFYANACVTFSPEQKKPSFVLDQRIFFEVLVAKLLDNLMMYSDSSLLIQSVVVLKKVFEVSGFWLPLKRVLQEKKSDAKNQLAVFEKQKLTNNKETHPQTECIKWFLKNEFGDKGETQLAFHKSADPKVLRVGMSFYSFLAWFFFHEYGRPFLPALVVTFDRRVAALDKASQFGQSFVDKQPSLSSDVLSSWTVQVVSLCYDLRGLVQSANTGAYFLFLAHFEQHWNSVFLRVFESCINNEHVSSAIIRLYAALLDPTETSGLPAGFSELSGISVLLSSDQLLLALVRNMCTVVGLLSRKVADAELRGLIVRDNVSQKKYRPLALAVRLLAAILGSTLAIPFGILQSYGDSGVADALEETIRLLFRSPFFEIVAHEKLCDKLFLLFKELTSRHITLLCKLDTEVFGPLLAIAEEGFSLPKMHLRFRAANIVANIFEFRAKNYLAPIFAPNKEAKKLEIALEKHSHVIRALFALLLDPFVENYSARNNAFPDGVYLLTLNYPSLFTNYFTALLDKQTGETRNKLELALQTLLEDVSWTVGDEEDKEVFSSNLVCFAQEIAELPLQR